MTLAAHLTGTSHLVHAMPAWSMKTRHAPSRRCRNARVYGDSTTAMHHITTPPPQSPALGHLHLFQIHVPARVVLVGIGTVPNSELFRGQLKTSEVGRGATAVLDDRSSAIGVGLLSFFRYYVGNGPRQQCSVFGIGIFGFLPVGSAVVDALVCVWDSTGTGRDLSVRLSGLDGSVFCVRFLFVGSVVLFPFRVRFSIGWVQLVQFLAFFLLVGVDFLNFCSLF